MFTPTEASGVGALGALIIGFPMGMGMKGLKQALSDTAAGVSAIFVPACHRHDVF